SGGQLALVHAVTRRAYGVICRSQHAPAAGMTLGRHRHVFKDFLFVPDVVSCGDNVRTQIEELFGDCGREAEAAGGVLAIDYEQIDGVRLHHMRQVLAHDPASRRPEHVSYKKNLHSLRLSHLTDSRRCGTNTEICVQGSRLIAACGSLLCMAQSGRFALSLRILAVLASEPD